MMKRIAGLCLVVLISTSGWALARETRPLQVAVWAPVQMIPAERPIEGLRLTLVYAEDQSMSGLSLGLGWSKTSGDMLGIGLGLVNWADGVTNGVQAGLVNYTGQRWVGLGIGGMNIFKGDATGVTIGVVNWTEGFVHGWQNGLVNYAGDRFIGWQNGGVNISRKDFSGLQTGAVNYVGGVMKGVQVGGIWNYAKEAHGVQIGLINGTESLNGLQVGLGNYNGNKDPMEFCPIVNWSF